MARTHKPGYYTVESEDTTALPQAFTQAYANYTSRQGNVRVSNLIMEYGGNKNALARELAGVGTGKLSSDESKRVQYQMKNISRWLNYEKGDRGSQARNPNNKATQARLQALMARKNPPKNMSVTVTGSIGYDEGDFRHRTVGNPPIQVTGSNLMNFLEAMASGDTASADRKSVV